MTRSIPPAGSGAGTQLEQAVDEALAKLRTKRITDHRIHQARRAIKKARAALRVLRPAIGDRVYRLENVTLRDAGRLLSPLRDARATLEIFDKLAARYAKKLVGTDVEPLHRLLEQDLVQVRRVVRRPSEPLDQSVVLLEAHRGRMRQAMTKADADSAESALRALKRIYRKGRKALAAAEAAGTPESLHEWRKQVKYLLNALDSVHGQWSKDAGKLQVRADKVADLLGEYHDLAVLNQIVVERATGALTVDASKALQAVIAERRRKLQKRSVRQGQRAYARKPGRFIRSLLPDRSAPG